MSASIDRRQFIAALPALALAPRILAQMPAPAFRVNGLSQITLTVSDVARSLDFYQGLFGMPVQARQDQLSLALVQGDAGPLVDELDDAAQLAILERNLPVAPQGRVSLSHDPSFRPRAASRRCRAPGPGRAGS